MFIDKLNFQQDVMNTTLDVTYTIMEYPAYWPPHILHDIKYMQGN